MNILYYNTVNSTNDLAFDLIEENKAKNHSLIIADSQTKGRGRQDRNWESPSGNLYCSLILQDVNLGKVTNYSFLIACVIGDVLKSFGVKTQYKWPNDIILNSKKLAGILLQFKKINNVDNLVIGFGVNLVNCPDYATCLKDNNVFLSKEEFLEKFEEIFLIYEEKYKQFGFSPIRQEWKNNAFKIGCEIELSNKKKGTFQDIDSEGNMVLLDCDGTIITSSVLEII